MLIEPILGYKSTWRILELLLETPRKKVSRKELFEHTLLGNAPLSEGLQRLTVAGLLLKEKKGKKESYLLNLGNDYIVFLQKLWELERKDLHYLDYEIKVLLSEITRQLIDRSGIKEIVLFGSHAKGTASMQSDIDLAVIIENGISENIIEIEITKMIQKIKEKFGKEIQIHYFQKEHFNDDDALAKEIKKEGIWLW